MSSAHTTHSTAQRDEESRLHGIIQSAMDAIITVDEKQHVLLFNAAAERIFRCPAGEAIGRPLDQFIPQRFRSPHRSHIERFGATGTTMRRMGDQTVLYALRVDGTEFPIEASISQAIVGGLRLFTVILRDITEREKAAAELERSHAKLLELYAAMHEVREAERTRIARELHDELAQWLTALKMDLSWLAARLPEKSGPLASRAGKMKSVLDTTVAAVRRIAADLRPVMLDDLGMVPAIEHLLHEFSGRTGILVSLDVDAEGVEFRDPLATAIYRMLQEALTNVARHAQASQVQVAIRLDDARLLVSARDNGKGIGAGALSSGKSHGILGIKERAQTLGGQANIYAPAGGGTLVEITVPAARYRTAGPAS
jgi:PAS domain S-box-containing protein